MNISIIVPVFNVEEYIAECLDSIVKQGLTDYEIICINDGSTDNTKNIIMDYLDKYPEVSIIDVEHTGPSCRNFGIENAKGNYIYFLDSDDYLLDGALNSMLEHMNDNQLDLLCVNATLNNDLSSYFSREFTIQTILTGTQFCEFFFSELSIPYPVPVWLYMFKRELLQDNNIMFIPHLIHEDEDFIPRCILKAKRISLLNKDMLYHRVQRPNSIMSSVTHKHLSDITLICRGLYSYYKKEKDVPVIFFRTINWIYIQCVKKSINHNINRKYFLTIKDTVIMFKCGQNSYERSIAVLSGISLRIAFAFSENKIPVFLRKIINHLIK